jgi:hypothetical protein
MQVTANWELPVYWVTRTIIHIITEADGPGKKPADGCFNTGDSKQ